MAWPSTFTLGKIFLILAVGTDDEGGPFDAHVLLAVHALLLPDAVGFGRFMVAIGQQGERQVELVLELGLRFGLIGGDADDYGVGFRELAGEVSRNSQASLVQPGVSALG